ncbi:patatin-like phospholipase family protein [Leptobacterium sp. I13]|uniref:patatin-like phospholipase family protein n=1 Tax=Leptobacterium meishanense TaxID=3128904 RepID=UPI0030ECC7FF
MRKQQITILFLLFFQLLIAQTNPQKDIKVGLVLSGGGAKGLAHIGALKTIEEAGVQIDYIGGTSMGAIIGALYASGYTAHQLDSIFQKVDFKELIQDKIPRDAKAFYEKDDEEKYFLTIPFDDFKINIPSALSRGQNTYDLLVKLLRHVSDVENFNELPIPFLCVATNLETGEPVILNKGYLPDAISASGAFPSLFAPVEIDGKLLIDGGVVNNYPINLVKAMGADVIIGVDVQHDLSDREALKSATKVLLQINNYRTVNDMKIKSVLTDIYIKPEMQNFTVVSFDDGKQIIDKGQTAASEKKAALEALALKQKPEIKDNPGIPQNDSVRVRKLTLKGNDRYTRAYIKGKLRVKLDRSVTYEKFNQGINNLSATNNFESIRYKLTPMESGGEHLTVNLKERQDQTFLKLGVHYDDLYKSAALINLTHKRLLFDDDVASLDVILGDNIRYNFEYYLDKGFYWSIGINSRFNSFEKDVDFDFVRAQTGFPDAEINRINIDVSDFTNQIYVQTVIREEFAFSLGLEHKHIKYQSDTIDEETDNAIFENSDFISTYGTLKLDTYDDKYFPKKGLFFEGDLHLYLYSSDFTGLFSEYSIGKAKMGVAFPLLEELSVNLSTEGGFTLGGSELGTFDFILGGYGNDFINNFIPFYGYDFISFGGNSYVKATLNVDYEFIEKNHFNVTVNYANAADDIFNNKEWITAPDFSGYALGYGLETFIGPVEVKYSWSPETKKSQWFFNLGFWF